MSADPQQPSSRTARLDDVLAAYLQAIEAGQSPDRLELAARHPDLADELAAFFANRSAIERLAAPLRAVSAGESPTIHLGDPVQPWLPDRIRYFGDYELQDEIARGGMGVVYKARQVKLNRVVAVKMILAGQLAGEADVRRFHAEAESAANLQHSNIVAIHEVGEHEGQHYFSMDYVAGRSLDAIVRDNPLAAERAARYVQIIAEAIEYAHQRGTLHRDLKPSNVLIGPDDQPRITDFGLARRMEDRSGLTNTGQVLGTPSYMPPEQAAARHDALGPASDVYSVGAILYELLTGRPPFKADSPLDTLMQVLNNEPVSPRLLNPKLPKDLETITLKCLEKEPRRRYATAAALAEDLRRFRSDQPILARPIGAVEQLSRWARRQRRGALIGVSAAVASMLLVLFGVLGWQVYDQSLMGQVHFDSDGPPLVAEVIDDEDDPVLAPFRLPTVEPVLLREGSYRVRLTGSGAVGKTLRFEVDRGGEQRFTVGLEDGRLGDSIDVWSPDAYEIVDLGHGPCILEAPHPASQPTKPATMRLFSPAMGRNAWSVTWDAVTAQIESFTGPQPPTTESSEGNSEGNRQLCEALARAWEAPADGFCRPRLMRPAVDLDGDGVADLVFSVSKHPEVAPAAETAALRPIGGSLIAMSGTSGAPLWWFRPKGTDGSTSGGTVAGTPLVVERGEGVPALVAAFTTANEAWLEAVDGRTGASLWRSTLSPVPAGVNPIARMYEPRLCNIAGRSVVAIICGTRIFGVDALTGQPAWPRYNAFPDQQAPVGPGVSPADAPRFGDLDGDGSDDIVMVENSGLNLSAFSLAAQKPLWRTSLTIDTGLFQKTTPHQWPLVADLDGDGKCEILVAEDRSTQGSGDGWHGLAVLDGVTGQVRWQRRFPIQRFTWATPDCPDRFAIGPDIDGDGVRDVVMVSAQTDRFRLENDSRRTNEKSLFVDAFSGQDGHRLWWSRIPLGDRPGTENAGPNGALAWGPIGGDGLPQLLIPLTHTVSIYRRSGMPVAGHPEFHSVFFLSTSTGRLDHVGDDLMQPQLADFDRDGIADLCAFTPNAPRQFKTLTPPVNPAGKLHVFHGSPPEAWRRLGAWEATGDVNGDGVADAAPPGSFAAQRLEDKPAPFWFVDGRDGRRLWPGMIDATGAGSGRAWNDATLSPVEGTFREFQSLPHGDFDRDGTADVLVATKFLPEANPSRLGLPLQAVSGKTGRRLWQAAPLALRPSSKYRFCALEATWARAISVESGGQPAVLVGVTSLPHYGPLDPNTGIGWEAAVMLLSGSDGTARWTHWFDAQMPDGVGAHSVRAAAAHVDLNGDGVADVVVVHPVAQNSAGFTCEVAALSGRDGKTLWTQKAFARSREELPTVAVVDRPHQKTTDVLVLEHRNLSVVPAKLSGTVPPPNAANGGLDVNGFVVTALDGESGELRWSFSPQPGDGRWLTSAMFAALNAGGGDGPFIALANSMSDGRSQIDLLDDQGQSLGRHATSSPWCLAADVDGDGRDDLVWLDGERLRATRGGFDSVIWERPISPRDAWGLEIQRAAAGGPATLAYAAGDAVYGFDGATGRTTWRGQSEFPGAAQLPRLEIGPRGQLPLVVSRSTERTESVARWVLPANDAEQYVTDARLAKALRPRDVESSTATAAGAAVGRGEAKGHLLAADPRSYRPLPWAPVGGSVDLAVAYNALFAGFYSLTVMFIPGWLIFQVVRNRTWGMGGMFVLTAAPAISLASYIAFRSLLARWLGDSMPVWGQMFVFPIAYLPMVGFPYFLIVWSARGQWRRVAWLLACAAAGTAVSAAIALAIDATERSALQHYSWNGWWVVILMGLYEAGAIAFAATLLRRPALAIFCRLRPRAAAA